MKRQHITAVLLAGILFLTACGGAEEDTETTADTQTEETVSTEETETEAIEEETKKQSDSYTNFRKLTVSGENAPYFDASTGLFVVQFKEENVYCHADDPCAVGISGDGEAYSVDAVMEMEAFPEFANGEYYTGIAVKPLEELYEGTYNITITFGEYIVSFPCTIE